MYKNNSALTFHLDRGINTKHNIQRGYVSVMVSSLWTVASLNQNRLDKTPFPLRACTYTEYISATRRNYPVAVVVSVLKMIEIVVIISHDGVLRLGQLNVRNYAVVVFPFS